MTDIIYGMEKVKSAWKDIEPLARSHFLEISTHSDWEFSPDIAMYERLESNGSLKLFTVRHGSRLVGYASYLIYRHPHANVMQAYQDAIYLSPDYRRSGLGKELIEFADSMFKNLGVGIVFAAVTERVDYSKTLLPMGYKLVDRLYARRL